MCCFFVLSYFQSFYIKYPTSCPTLISMILYRKACSIFFAIPAKAQPWEKQKNEDSRKE